MFDDKTIKSDDVVIIEVPNIENWTIKELRYTCKHNKIKGYSKMSREQMIVQINEIINKVKNNF